MSETVKIQPDDNNSSLLPYQPGAIVDSDYRLLAYVGRGGMGVVYTAEHRYMTGKLFALKILNSDALTPQNLRRFHREAQALGKLSHKGIVHIYNFGIDRDTTPYYVMELIDGESLSELIKRSGPLSEASALFVLEQVAQALAYAHRNGIVHRDLKPGNLMLVKQAGTGAPLVKIVDFGLVRFALDDSAQRQALTATGEVFGTPYYMSPEQASGGDITASSDIYSLGCTIFEALTGVPPFRGANAFETLTMHQQKTAPWLQEALPQGVFSHGIEDLVAKMLRKNPLERYQSLAQVAHDLERIKEGKPLLDEVIELESDRQMTSSSLMSQVEESSGLPRRLVIAGGSVAVLLAGVLLLALLKVNEPKPALAPSKGNSASTPSVFGKDDLSFDLPRTARDRLIAASPVFNAGHLPDGSQIFQFPQKESVGEIDWGAGPIQAIGRVVVPPGNKPEFLLDVHQSLFAIDKLAPDSVNLSVEIDNIDRLKQMQTLLVKWHGLARLRFKDCDFDEHFVSLLNQLPPVGALQMSDCAYQTTDFAQCKALSQQACDLKIDHITDLESPQSPAPAGLKSFFVTALANKKLVKWSIDHCFLPAELATLVSQSKTITSLEINQVDISAAQLKQFCHMPSLVILKVLHCPYSYQQILAALPDGRSNYDLQITAPQFVEPYQRRLARVQRAVPGNVKPWSREELKSISKRVKSFAQVERTYVQSDTGQFVDLTRGVADDG